MSVGAERLNDKFLKAAIFSLFTYWLVTALGRRLVLFPCTVGPLYRRSTRWLTGFVLKNVDLILVRDRESLDIVKGLNASAGRRVRASADVALMQRDVHGFDMASLLGKPLSGPMVGFSVMKWTYVHTEAQTDFANYSAYVHEMAELADRVIERYGVTAVFVPTNYPVHGCREDDVATSLEVIAQMRHNERAALVRRLPSPGELKVLLGQCEVNVTTRMHACILSTSAGAPTMSVNYLFKLRGYMESLDAGACSIDIEDFCAEKAFEVFERLWEERPRWRCLIAARVAERGACLSKSLEALNDIV